MIEYKRHELIYCNNNIWFVLLSNVHLTGSLEHLMACIDLLEAK